MIFADKLIQLRKKSGWSQEELAAQMNVSRQSVSKWESAQSVPDLEKILQLGRIFGVSTDYLLKDELEETEYAEASAGETAVRRVTLEEAGAFLRVKEYTARRIAFAVMLCILSPIPLMLLAAASETGALSISENFACGAGMIVLLLLAAAAVAVFLSCGSRTSPFAYLEEEVFETEYGVSGMVRERQKQYRDTYTRSNVLGACICILSLVPLFAAAFLTEDSLLMMLALSATLLIAGVGAGFFIVAGINWESTQKLLQEGDYTRRRKRSGNLPGAVSTAYWLVAVAIYLALSFLTNDWQSSWIVWPVAGVLYAAVAVLGGALAKREK